MDSDFWHKIKKVSQACGIKYTTCWAWKKRGKVPASNHYKLLKKAAELNIDLTYEELIVNASNDPRIGCIFPPK